MMLELTIKDFIAATHTKNVFQAATLNTLQKMEKIENLSKEIKDTDKNQMENFKMKSTVSKAKHSLDVFKKQNGEGSEKNQ